MKTLILILCSLFLTLGAAAQSVVWVEQGSGPLNTYGNAIARDLDGFLYVTGKFRDTVNFGAFQLTESNFGTPYCVKYDSAGTVMWVKKDMGGDGVVFDGDSHIYLWNEEKLDLQKVDLSGTLAWNKTMLTTSIFGSSGIMNVQATATDLYLTGYISGDGQFGNDTVTNVGGWDIFVARYDADGNNVWARGGGGGGLDKGYTVFADGNGSVYATGYYADTAQFGATSLTSAGSKDAYLAKYTSAGTQLWVKSFGGAGFDLAAAMTQDEAGDIYITGRFHTEITFGSTTLTGNNLNAFITKFDADGNAIWAQSISGQGDDEEADLYYDHGQLNFICTTAGDIVADNFSLTGLGGLDMAIGEMDTMGNVVWIKLFGGDQQDEGAGLTGSGASLYFCGSFNATATFDAFSLTSVGSWDVVTGKLFKDGTTMVTPPQGTASTFSLYPNPAQDAVTLQSTQPMDGYSLEVWNLQGILLMRVPSLRTTKQRLDISQLPQGLYLVVLTQGTKRETLRLVK